MSADAHISAYYEDVCPRSKARDNPSRLTFPVNSVDSPSIGHELPVENYRTLLAADSCGAHTADNLLFNTLNIQHSSVGVNLDRIMS